MTFPLVAAVVSTATTNSATIWTATALNVVVTVYPDPFNDPNYFQQALHFFRLMQGQGDAISLLCLPDHFLETLNLYFLPWVNLIGIPAANWCSTFGFIDSQHYTEIALFYYCYGQGLAAFGTSPTCWNGPSSTLDVRKPPAH